MLTALPPVAVTGQLWHLGTAGAVLTAMARALGRSRHIPEDRASPALLCLHPQPRLCPGQGSRAPLTAPTAEGQNVLQRGTGAWHSPISLPSQASSKHTDSQGCWRCSSEVSAAARVLARLCKLRQEAQTLSCSNTAGCFFPKNTPSRLSPPIQAFLRGSHGETADLKCRSLSCTGKPPSSHTN